MGAQRKTRRGGMLVEKQDRFVRLIAHGVTNSEACRMVGINRRTGTRWRYGRTILNTAGERVHYPAVCLISRGILVICLRPSGQRSLTCAGRVSVCATSPTSLGELPQRCRGSFAATVTIVVAICLPPQSG